MTPEAFTKFYKFIIDSRACEVGLEELENTLFWLEDTYPTIEEFVDAFVNETDRLNSRFDRRNFIWFLRCVFVFYGDPDFDTLYLDSDPATQDTFRLRRLLVEALRVLEDHLANV